MIYLALLGVSYADEAVAPTESLSGGSPALEKGSADQAKKDLPYDPWTEAESILSTDDKEFARGSQLAPAEAREVQALASAAPSDEESGPEPALNLAADEKRDSLEPIEATPTASESPLSSSQDTEQEVRRPLALPESEDVERLSATTLNGVKTLTMEQGVLIYLEADGLLGDASYFPLENPDRLVIDLVGIKNKVADTRFSIPSEQVRRIRVGTHPDKIRVVLDGGRKAVDFENPRVVSSQTGLYLSLGTGEDLQSAFGEILMGDALNLSWNDAVLSAKKQAPEATPSAKVDTAAPTVESDAPAASVALLPDVVAEVLPAALPQTAPAAPAQAVAVTEAPEARSLGQEEESEALAVVDALPSSTSAPEPPKVGFLASQEAPAEERIMPGKSAPAEVFGLQFERNEDRDRVAILLDTPVEYSVFEPDAETVMLRIPNARFAGDTGERITPESGGPVSLVTTFEQPDLEGSEVRVVMRRAKGLSPKIIRRSTVILVDFENQGVAANAPPAFLPDEPAFLSEEETYANLLVAEGRLPSDSANLPGANVDPDTSPVSELEKGEANGTVDSHALAAALGDAEARTAAKASSLPAKKSEKKAPAPPAALGAPAAVDVLSEGGLIDGKRYTGRRISLDFKDVLMTDVLRLVAEVSDLNIIAGDEVKGSITIRLVEVPWDQALDVILLTKGLGFVRVGNVLRIAPDEILKAEEESRLQERRQKEKLEDLEIKLQPINYADVKEVKSLVSRLLSPRGTVNVDARTNTVIIKDISGVIDEAVALIKAIDTQTPQVMIEAKIVEANLDFARELGSTWSFGSQPYTDGFAPGALRTDLGSENFKFAGQNNVVVGNPITSAATGTVNFGAFLLDDKMQVDVHIQAMEQAGEGKVISSPRIVTLDNREAIIEQGVSIPFQTFESGDAKLEFIDAVLSLQVTPHITTDKSIIMALEVARNAPDSSVPTPTGSPAIAKNQAKTETLVKDGQTLVIGGIYTIEKSTRESRVPYLSKIPFLGKAFKSRQVSDKRKELLIFVTPRIVVNPAMASN